MLCITRFLCRTLIREVGAGLVTGEPGTRCFFRIRVQRPLSLGKRIGLSSVHPSISLLALQWDNTSVGVRARLCQGHVGGEQVGRFDGFMTGCDWLDRER